MFHTFLGIFCKSLILQFGWNEASLHRSLRCTGYPGEEPVIPTQFIANSVGV